MVNFENFVKSMPSSLSKLKFTPIRNSDDFMLFLIIPAFEDHDKKNNTSGSYQSKYGKSLDKRQD